MKTKYLLVALAAGVATPAMAQTAPSGGRVEALVGYDSVSFDVEDFGDFSRDGIVFGIGAGYDFAMGSTVAVGVDIEATESTTDVEVNDGGDSAELSMGRDLYAGLRLTGAVAPNVNVYGKLGYSNARVKARLDIGGDEESEGANLDGIRAGVGAQFGLGTSAYLMAEYRYSNYEAGVSRHQAVGGIGFRF